MKPVIVGECILMDHPYDPKLKVVVKDFDVIWGRLRITIRAGTVTDGASIPWPFTIWLDRYDEDYITAATTHDVVCGQYGPRQPMLLPNGTQVILSWKQGAVLFRELLKIDKDNRKVVRRVFYHAVMLKKRIGQRR